MALSAYQIEQTLKAKKNLFQETSPTKIKAINDFKSGKINIDEARRILKK